MASGLQLRRPERRRIRKTCTSILQARSPVSNRSELPFVDLRALSD